MAVIMFKVLNQKYFKMIINVGKGLEKQSADLYNMLICIIYSKTKIYQIFCINIMNYR